eukprot:s788_g7.t1
MVCHAGKALAPPYPDSWQGQRLGRPNASRRCRSLSCTKPGNQPVQQDAWKCHQILQEPPTDLLSAINSSSWAWKSP